MLVKLMDIAVEQVNKGKTKYGKAVVTYNSNGSNRTQNLMSFSNPDVYKKFTDGTFNVGDTVDVTVTKNDNGFNQWSKVDKAEAAAAGPDIVIPSTQAPRSNFESREERAARQIYIIKQSSIGHALEYLKATSPAGEWGVSDVTNVAQEFVDYVLGTEENLASADADNT